MAPRKRLGEAESTGMSTFPLRLLKSLCAHRADEKMSVASSIPKVIWGGAVRGKVKRGEGEGSGDRTRREATAAAAAVSSTRLRADTRSGEEGGAGCDTAAPGGGAGCDTAAPGGEEDTAASSREDAADVYDGDGNGSPDDERPLQQQQDTVESPESPSTRSVSFNEVVKEVLIANRRQMYGNRLTRRQHFYSKAELALFKRAWYRHLTLARGPVDRLLRCGCPGCNKGEGCLPSHAATATTTSSAADDYNCWTWEA